MTEREERFLKEVEEMRKKIPAPTKEEIEAYEKSKKGKK